MKKCANYLILFLLMLTVFWPSPAYAKGLFDDKVVFGGTYTLESGQTLDGNLVIFGGAVTTEADSTVTGDIALIGGVAEIGGEVQGNMVGIGGAVQLTSSAVVNGDLVTIGATLSRAEGAQVYGQIVNGIGIPFSLDVPGSSITIPEIPGESIESVVPNVPQVSQIPGINVSFNPLLDMMWFFFRTFMFALLAVLVVIFFDKSTERVSRAAVEQPAITTGAGLLTAFLSPLALIAMTITIILIPVTLITIFALVVAWLFGWISIGLEVGKRIAKLFNTEWAPAVSAGIGTFILFLVLGGISELIPCVGWLPLVLVGLWGLGAVIMTRFGTQEYNPAANSTDLATSSSQGQLVSKTPQLEVHGDDETTDTSSVEAVSDADSSSNET